MRIIISGQGEKERFPVCPSPPHWRTSENCLASLAKIYKGWLGIANLKKIYKDRLDLGVTWLK